jgi:hypothetical protein
LPLWRLTWTAMWQWPTCQTVYTFCFPLGQVGLKRHNFLPPLPPLNRHHTLQSSTGRRSFLPHTSPPRQRSPNYQSVCTCSVKILLHAPPPRHQSSEEEVDAGRRRQVRRSWGLSLSLLEKEEAVPLVPVSGAVRHHRHPGERREGGREGGG